jgi:hypothetical protein
MTWKAMGSTIPEEERRRKETGGQMKDVGINQY